MMDTEKLIISALRARENSYSPYSGYAVGAAIETSTGEIFSGCNVENASYGATCCAERSALFSAVSAGYRDFTAIAIVGGKTDEAAPLSGYAPPCGICRQVLSEFGDIKVIVAKDVDNYDMYMLSQLIPCGFDF